MYAVDVDAAVDGAGAFIHVDSNTHSIMAGAGVGIFGPLAIVSPA